MNSTCAGPPTRNQVSSASDWFGKRRPRSCGICARSAGVRSGKVMVDQSKLRQSTAKLRRGFNRVICSPSLPRLIEMAQIRRRLVLAARHQEAVAAQVIKLVADADQGGAVGAIGFGPFGMLRGPAHVTLVDGPGARERIVHDG